MSELHRVRIEAGKHTYLTRVWIDEQEVRGVVGVAFGARLGSFTRDDDEPLVMLTIAPQAVRLHGAGAVPLHVLEHSRLDRDRRRPLWLRRPGLRTRVVRAWQELVGR